VSYPRLLEQLRQDHLKDPMNSPDIKLLLDRDVVLIDDVAPMRNFPIIIMEAIPLVIRHRYNQMKSVIVTSRLPVEGSTGETIVLELGNPAVSRLSAMGPMLGL